MSFFSLLVGLVGITFSAFSQESEFSVIKIWDHANHNAFTDLARYEEKFYCTFREADSHSIDPSGVDGKIRVLVSTDGKKWDSFALFSMPGKDLRDPKLSCTPDGRLMLLAGASDWDKTKEKHLKGCQTHVAFLENETGRFSALHPIRFDEDLRSGFNWLWRVTWWRGVGYGVVYRPGKNNSDEKKTYLVKTTNGVEYSLVTRLEIPDAEFPNESAIAFTRNDEMVILVRSDGKVSEGFIGRSVKPYTRWGWTKTVRLGGPAIIPYTDDQFVVVSRSYHYEKNHTTLYRVDPDNKLDAVTELPSHRDCAYAGMVFYDNKLWISYYSSHEGRASIYLATVPVSYIGHHRW